MFSPLVDLLLLILIANGTPVVAHRLMRGRLNRPLDFGLKLSDGKRLLGDSKTWRGVLSALPFSAFCAWEMGYEWLTGLMIAALALTGDALSSFIKRRFDQPASSQVLLLDQIPESLLPAALMAQTFGLSITDVVLLVTIFIVAELSLSRLMYELGVRRRPY